MSSGIGRSARGSGSGTLLVTRGTLSFQLFRFARHGTHPWQMGIPRIDLRPLRRCRRENPEWDEVRLPIKINRWSRAGDRDQRTVFVTLRIRHRPVALRRIKAVLLPVGIAGLYRWQHHRGRTITRSALGVRERMASGPFGSVHVPSIRQTLSTLLRYYCTHALDSLNYCLYCERHRATR